MPNPRLLQTPDAAPWHFRASWMVWGALNLLVALGYVQLGRLGMSLAYSGSNIAPLWPAAGLALGVALIAGPRILPGILLGAFFADYLFPVPFNVAIWVGLGGSLEAMGAAWVLVRYLGFDPGLGRIRDVMGLTLLGGGLFCALAATIGITAHTVGGLVPWSEFGPAWRTWFTGDLLGTLLVAPPILVWSQGGSRLRGSWKALLAIFALLILISFFVFRSTWSDSPFSPLAFLVVPLVLWIALRFGPRGGTLASLMVGSIAILETLARQGGSHNFAQLLDHLVLLQAFLIVLALSALLMAALGEERRAAQASLEVSESRFRTLFEETAQAILLLDPDTRVFVDFNKAAVEMLRCRSKEELLSLPPWELSPEFQPDGRPSEEKAHDMIQTSLRRGSHRFEWIHRSPHREDFPVEVLLTPVRLGDRSLIITNWWDITERLRMESELRLAHKLEGLGVMAGGIAHDFNNLLGAILGNLERLERASGPNAPLHALRSAVDRASDLARRMLVFAGSGGFGEVSLDLSPLVIRVSEVLAPLLPPHIGLARELAEGLPSFEGNPEQLQQVIEMLVTNAREAIGERAGRIVLRTGVEPDMERVEGCRFPGRPWHPGPYVFLEVEDTGCGISAELLPRIFDPFFSTKFAGRGLSLAAVQGVVRQLGGGVRVRSQPDQGSTFTLYFPAKAPEARPALERLPAAPHTEASPVRILLVDDEPLLLESTSELLLALGYEVVQARNGEEALALFQGGAVDAVLMDVTMPRMDGISAFKAMKQADPEARIVLSSGFSAQEALATLDRIRPAGFLPKPYSLQDLQAVLLEVVGPAR